MNRRTTLLFLFCPLAACDQDSQPAGPEPPEAVIIGAPASTVEVPDAFKTKPSVLRVDTDVGFDRDNGAFNIGWATYRANNARIDVGLEVRTGTFQMRRKSGTKEESFWLPKLGQIAHSVNNPIDRTCGHVATGDAKATAWHSFLLKWTLFKWGNDIDSDWDSARQPRCEATCDDTFLMTPEEEEECQGGSGSGGSGDLPDPDRSAEGPSTDGLTCGSEHVWVYADDDLIWEGEASVCA